MTQAVKEAISQHGIPCYMNSDQGCQFTSNEYKKLLKDHEIIQSMDGKSRWADNIMIERWFRSLKTENIYINEYLTPRSLRQGISAYIEQYNMVRPHEALAYKTNAVNLVFSRRTLGALPPDQNLHPLGCKLLKKLDQNFLLFTLRISGIYCKF